MKKRLAIIGIALGAVMALAGAAAAGLDWGMTRDALLASQSTSYFGVGKPLASSSSAQVTQAQAQADPTSLVTLAGGLHARVVTTQGGVQPDQISLWPNSAHPTYLIECNEGDTTDPGLERINIATGAEATIVTGTESCDPTRITPWGTILFGEEDGSGPNGGRLYELIDPLNTTGVTLDRQTGTFSGGTGAGNLVARTALGRASFEGLGILSNGVTYVDPDDPDFGPKNGHPGNPYFKFVPATLWTAGDPPITDLSQSPYVSGTYYGFQAEDGSSYGQGREFGTGRWVQLAGGTDPDIEHQGRKAGLTGYYRPEDMDVDGTALKQGQVRICGTDTGDESNHLYGQVICISDGTLSQAANNTATPQAEPFVIGGTSQGINMPDNVAFQPSRGNWILHEDAETTSEFPHNNDLWDCLPDGNDQDLLSDGCVRVGTLNDLTAEWTGGIFNAAGTHFYVSVQHNISGEATILDITGWK
jgi:secreted PhoX family phosphatase